MQTLDLSRPIYIVLSGLPGSGKTTFVADILNKWRHPKPVIVSTDDYIQAIADAKGSNYSAEFKRLVADAETYAKATRQDALQNRRDIIHDQTNLNAKSRMKRIASVPPEYLKVCVLVACKESERQERLSRRFGKFIPPEIDSSMRTSQEPVSEKEGFDIVISADIAWEILQPLFREAPAPADLALA